MEGLELPEIAMALSSFPGVPGRFQILDLRLPYKVIIDYAHCETSLRHVMNAARGLSRNRLILVFGCTGERDRRKRPIMGALGVSLADWLILTSDDPYGEDPDSIITEIVQGIPLHATNWSSQVDRSLAVREALAMAKPGDVVLLAGKGGETVQKFAGYSIPYSDEAVVKEALALKEE